ncbi:class I adenylate-forming enzyme family protein [Streptomyces sp. Je 1-369]|uniref:class I adenylate-forming enzyme family protein n=1 Tax=Streptomyces sp. Je 1-369 TaxID=2966192 RepID=UPI0022857522|nr:class I adenylate-forming enzyme family protein [Streptomyces sp. Je 1-369]WAL96406.1 acyl--CoA ligase [Streptomyces sp. Je 1-369]
MSADTLLGVYERQAASTPDGEALVYARAPYEGTTLTWRELLERGRELASKLRAAGLGPGGRCAVVMIDHPDVLPGVLAVWQVGGVPVLLDSQWGRATTRSVLRLSAVETIFDAARGTCERAPAVGADPPPLPGDTALLSYTSGSTSDPRGVVLSHGQLLHAYRSGGAALTALLGQERRRFGVTMRLSGLGILGMNYLWPAVMGIPVTVLPELSLASAKGYWARLREHDVDVTYLVPPLVDLLTKMSVDPGAGQGDTIACLSGGAPLFEQSQRAVQQNCRAVLLNVYGLTEVSFAAFFGDIGPDGLATHSIGRPATVEARLRSADGSIVVGPGEGELELHGPAVSHGYYANDAANKELFREGWVRTGDLASRDASGRYRITGRHKDVVLRGAFTVYLHEIEEAANGHPGVLEAAAVRLQLPAGEDVGLLVRMAPGPDAETTTADLRKHLSLELGHQRTPRRIVKTTEPLPRLAQHKIDRRAAHARWHALNTPDAKE